MLGIGDWGLGIAIPNPQSPIPIIVLKLKLITLYNKINIKTIIYKNIN